jgi:glucokinase
VPVAPARDAVIAIDVGGTSIKSALVTTAHLDGPAAPLAVHRHPTGAEQGADAVVDTIMGIAGGHAAEAAAAGLSARAAGIVAPGVIDEDAGVAVWAANIGFRSVPLRDLAEKALGLPAALGHDVRAGALAEARLGAGRGVGRVWFVAIGTGIAGAYVRDGRTDPGAHGGSGEIGHVVVRADGPECPCGQRGCVEVYASASAVARRYHERLGAPARGERDPANGEVTAAGVVARLDRDPVAREVWAEAVDALADGLRVGVTLHDPDVIVIGGGLAEAGAALFEPLAATLRGRLTFQTMPALVPATLGDQAGCLGAALLAHALVAP